MKTFAKNNSARRGFGRAVEVAAPVAIVAPRLVRQRMLASVWTVDPSSNRLVCCWSERWSTEDRAAGDAEPGDTADVAAVRLVTKASCRRGLT